MRVLCIVADREARGLAEMVPRGQRLALVVFGADRQRPAQEDCSSTRRHYGRCITDAGSSVIVQQYLGVVENGDPAGLLAQAKPTLSRSPL